MKILQWLRRWLRSPAPMATDPPDCCDCCDLDLDTVKVEIVAPEIVYWCVVGVQHVGYGDLLARRSRVCETPRTAFLYARRLAHFGYDVDVYRWPCPSAEAAALHSGRQVRSGAHELALGLRPRLCGAKAIGVG